MIGAIVSIGVLICGFVSGAIFLRWGRLELVYGYSGALTSEEDKRGSSQVGWVLICEGMVITAATFVLTVFSALPAIMKLIN